MVHVLQNNSGAPTWITYTSSTKVIKILPTTYTDAGTYLLKVVATMNNNQTLSSNYVLTVLYTCTTSAVTSNPVANITYDVSAGGPLTVTQLNWESNDTAQYCDTQSVMYWSAYWAVWTAVDAEVFNIVGDEYIVSTSNAAKVGVYDIALAGGFSY